MNLTKQQKKTLTACNDLLRQELGTVDGAQPRFAWVHSTQIDFYVQEASRIVEPAPGGVIAMSVPVYTRLTVDEWSGPHWCIAQWGEPPMDERSWRASFGDQVPYPAKGKWYALDATQLAPHDFPDRQVTEYLMRALRAQRERSFCELKNDAKEQGDRPRREFRQRIKDDTLSSWPAFDHAPGKKDHVSLPAGSVGGLV